MQYEIKGGNLPVVVCSLESGEQMITESGGMSWMSVNMKMETNISHCIPNQENLLDISMLKLRKL